MWQYASHDLVSTAASSAQHLGLLLRQEARHSSDASQREAGRKISDWSDSERSALQQAPSEAVLTWLGTPAYNSVLWAFSAFLTPSMRRFQKDSLALPPEEQTTAILYSSRAG